jgi:protoporphyrinogen oxidase
MRDVVVIGGGLTGLAAAWELERLGVGYTLIEVKGRLGGSIKTVREHGFTVDAGSFIMEKYAEWPFLAALGLDDALEVVGKYRDGDLVIFKDGTQTLVDALAARITQPVMLRMAVSSLGELPGGRFGVCLENGLLLDAGAVIVTAPARYAEHMLRTLQPEIAYRLMDYRYDSVARVTLGYRREDVGEIPESPPEDYGITFWQWTAHPSRVPPDHVMIRAGLRLSVEDDVPENLALQLAALMQWPLNPVIQRADYWPEADPLTRHLPEHAENMDAIQNLLKPGVALAGSDYRAKRLDQQVEQGRAAALAVAAHLGKASRSAS